MSREQTRGNWLPSVTAAGLALLVYAVSLGGTYVYDDLAAIRLDPRVASPRLWGHYWTQAYFPDAVDNLYRPLVSMSYGIQWWLHGDRPWAFHAVNWLLHAAAAAAVAELTRRLAGRSAAFIAGMLFAVHPIHVEAVANIVGRSELGCTLAILLALILFWRRPLTPGRVALIFLLQIVAVLCKEQGMLLPLLLLFFGWFIWRRGGPPAPSERAALRWLIILITWSLSAYIIGREHFLRFEWNRDFLDWGTQPMKDSFGLDRVLMPLVLVGHYIQLLFFPIHLSPDYGASVIGSTVRAGDPYLWLGVTAVIAWTAALMTAFFRRAYVVIFCLISMAAAYGMVGNIFSLIGTNLAERLMYLPSVFFLMLIGMAVAKIRRTVGVPLLAALLAAASLRTVTYARLWNDPMELFTQALARQPRSSQLYLLVSREYLVRGDDADAAMVLQQATDRFPNYWHAWVQRALIAMDRGRLTEADQCIQRAFVLSPNGMVIGAAQKLEALKAATRPTVPGKSSPDGGKS